MKKILVLGGTGAMGTYLVPKLAERGYSVDVVSIDDMRNKPGINYIKADAYDRKVMAELLKKGYDAIVDFMIYDTARFAERYEMLLENTEHYIYLSSYRIYADEEHPITETSPRLLDVSEDREFLGYEDYSLYKARGENILRSSKFKNWTIIRPAITYSKHRFQLVTLEANTVVARARQSKPVLVPKKAMEIRGTMSWGGDIAEMIARLVLNKDAICEIFTVSTAEHNAWKTVAEYYKELIGLCVIPVETEIYLNCFDNYWGARYQLIYDRFFDRIVDNSKILRVTGMKQSELMPLYKGLEKELSALPKDYDFGSFYVNDNMDKILKTL